MKSFSKRFWLGFSLVTLPALTLMTALVLYLVTHDDFASVGVTIVGSLFSLFMIYPGYDIMYSELKD